MLQEVSCFAHDEGPLVFIVGEGLLQNEDSEKSQIDNFSVDSIGKLNGVKSLQDVNVFNLAPFNALRKHRAGLEVPIAFRGLPLEHCDEGWLFRNFYCRQHDSLFLFD